MPEHNRCIVCQIVAGDADAYRIYEDEKSMAILDINPFAKGHCLVIPKRHVPWWHELTDEENTSLFKVAKIVSNKMMETFRTLVTGISSSMDVEGAIIAIEPSTGYITTMVGGYEYTVGNQYNRAVQARRQPGSSFKPFIYGCAIEAKKISTATILPDVPLVDIDASGDTWAPGNYEGDYKGMVPITYALAACSLARGRPAFSR
jgi:membrane carboxypeptidase/penicillin-binding protein